MSSPSLELVKEMYKDISSLSHWNTNDRRLLLKAEVCVLSSYRQFYIDIYNSTKGKVQYLASLEYNDETERENARKMTILNVQKDNILSMIEKIDRVSETQENMLTQCPEQQ